jgi:hypothetical protein
MSGQPNIAAPECRPSFRHLIKRYIDSDLSILGKNLREYVIVLNVRVIIHHHGQDVSSARGILVQINIRDVRLETRRLYQRLLLRWDRFISQKSALLAADGRKGFKAFS